MPKIAEIEPTPNPNAKKFVLKEPLTFGVSRNFDNAEAAKQDKLAAELFAIPHVTNVYYMDRWVTITQDGQADWADLLRQVAVPIRAASMEETAGNGAAPAQAQPIATNPEDEVRLRRINEVLDTQIRPGLAMDGGGIQIIGLEENVLKIRYQGACGSCPSSLYGTMMAIENMLRAVEPDLMVMAV
jgi:Fe-S cluster biogenesis protein NfuA